MIRKADAIIIGGGIIGAAIAHFLSRAKVKVVLFEKQRKIGRGISYKSFGMIRQLFSCQNTAEMAKYSNEFYHDFEKHTSATLRFTKTGSMMLACTQSEFDKAVEIAKELKDIDVKTNLLESKDVKQISELFNLRGLKTALHCAEDGFINIDDAILGFAESAMKNGATIYDNTEVLDFIMEYDSIAGVLTDKGKIRADIVVNAAGLKAHEIARIIGIDLPISPYRKQYIETMSSALLNGRLPCVYAFNRNYSMVQKYSKLYFFHSDPQEIPMVNNKADYELYARLLEHIIKRLPVVDELDFGHSKASTVMMSNDFRPIVAVDKKTGLISAVGMNGYGFSIAPAVGLAVSELILKGKISTFDEKELDTKRFDNPNNEIEYCVI